MTEKQVLVKICITVNLFEHEHALVHCSRNCKRKTGVLQECLLLLGYPYVLYLLMYTNEETVRLMPTPGDIRNGVESQPLMITPHR